MHHLILTLTMTQEAGKEVKSQSQVYIDLVAKSII